MFARFNSKISIVMLILLLPTKIFSTEAFVFNTKNFDCGTIKNLDKPVHFAFNFKNTSNVPISVGGINANFRCISLGNSENKIAIGDTGFIGGIFDPSEISGMIDNRLSVFILVGDSLYSESLSIRGTVIKGEKVFSDEKIPAKVQGDKVSSTNKAIISKGIMFKIQIEATQKLIDPTDTCYKGISVIKENLDKNLFRYTIGTFNDYNAAASIQRQLEEKGFSEISITSSVEDN